MVLFHLIFLLCTTIQPKIRILIHLFLFSFAQDHPTKLYYPLSFILSLCTTFRPKIRVLINLLFLFVHNHLTKLEVTLNLYFFLNCANISFVIFMTVLPLYFLRSVSGSTTFIFSYTIFMEVLLLYLVRYIYGYMKVKPLLDIQATTERRFTLKRVHDKITSCSHSSVLL